MSHDQVDKLHALFGALRSLFAEDTTTKGWGPRLLELSKKAYALDEHIWRTQWARYICDTSHHLSAPVLTLRSVKSLESAAFFLPGCSFELRLDRVDGEDTEALAQRPHLTSLVYDDIFGKLSSAYIAVRSNSIVRCLYDLTGRVYEVVRAPGPTPREVVHEAGEPFRCEARVALFEPSSRHVLECFVSRGLGERGHWNVLECPWSYTSSRKMALYDFLCHVERTVVLEGFGIEPELLDFNSVRCVTRSSEGFRLLSPGQGSPISYNAKEFSCPEFQDRGWSTRLSSDLMDEV